MSHEKQNKHTHLNISIRFKDRRKYLRQKLYFSFQDKWYKTPPLYKIIFKVEKMYIYTAGQKVETIN